MNACLRPLCVAVDLPNPFASPSLCRLSTETLRACSATPRMTEQVLDRMRMEYLSEKHREAYRQGPGEARDGSRSPYSGR